MGGFTRVLEIKFVEMEVEWSIFGCWGFSGMVYFLNIPENNFPGIFNEKLDSN
jgi:hypothetical protein